MTLELRLVVGFILHLIGDYITQNHWLATEKTKRFLPAFIHATIYSLPFLAICWSKWWFVIWISHFFIDRYRLAVYVVRAKNSRFIDGKFCYHSGNNHGFDSDVPIWLSTWLMIIVDNILHLVINSVSIYFGNI